MTAQQTPYQSPAVHGLRPASPQQVLVLPLQRAQPLLAGKHAGAVGIAQLRHLSRQLVHLQAGRGVWSTGMDVSKLSRC